MEGLGPHANYLAHRGQIEAWGHRVLPKNLMDSADWKQLGRQFPHFQEVNSYLSFQQLPLLMLKLRNAQRETERLLTYCKTYNDFIYPFPRLMQLAIS